jgi:hypothetical protein
MRQLKEAMDKEARYGELIHSLTQASRSQGDGDSNNSSPEKGMAGAKSTGQIGLKKKKRRDRAITTGTAEMDAAGDKGRLPKLAGGGKQKDMYRHNHTRAFHCFN